MASSSTSKVFRYITHVKPDGSDGSKFPIRKHYVVLGRSWDADIRISLDTVSQHHCSFQTDFNGQTSLVNMSTTHPLTVNGESLTSRSLHIKHGDIVTVGGRQFRYEEVERTSSKLATSSLQIKLSNQNLVGAIQPKSPRPGLSQVDNVLTRTIEPKVHQGPSVTTGDATLVPSTPCTLDSSASSVSLHLAISGDEEESSSAKTSPKSPATPDYTGIERMVKTPRDKPKSPETPALDGIVRMTKTPNRRSRSLETPALDGIVRMVKTPKQQPKTPNFDGMAEMMKSPVRLPRNSVAGADEVANERSSASWDESASWDQSASWDESPSGDESASWEDSASGEEESPRAKLRPRRVTRAEAMKAKNNSI